MLLLMLFYADMLIAPALMRLFLLALVRWAIDTASQELADNITLCRYMSLLTLPFSQYERYDITAAETMPMPIRPADAIAY